ncbi:cell division protein FtsQ/DivIB [Marinomonas epiphytica]
MRLAALIGAILLVLVATFQDDDPLQDWFQIEQINVEGDLKYTNQQALASEFNSLLGTSLFDLSAVDLVAVVEASPWVEKAQVRKVWPNELTIIVEEHTPLAYWQEGQLISTKAVTFVPSSIPDLPIPHLYGPEGSSDVVLEQFGLISQVLSGGDLRIVTLSLEARGAWSVTFGNGLQVKLGREEILERLQRFITVYKSDLSGRIGRITSVDARYPHGVAVGWKEVE